MAEAAVEASAAESCKVFPEMSSAVIPQEKSLPPSIDINFCSSTASFSQATSSRKRDFATFEEDCSSDMSFSQTTSARKRDFTTFEEA